MGNPGRKILIALPMIILASCAPSDSDEDALRVTTRSLRDGMVRGFYSDTVDAAGGKGDYTYALIGGALPDGTQLDPIGRIWGTCQTEGVFPFTLEVTAGKETARKGLSITVLPSGGGVFLEAILDRDGNPRSDGHRCERLTAIGQGIGTATAVEIGGIPATTLDVQADRFDFVIPSAVPEGYTTLDLTGPFGLIQAQIVIKPMDPAGTPRLIICGESEGITIERIGVVEGGTYNLADLIDLGAATYRIYLQQDRAEPTDDDGNPGKPDIADIKADPDLVPWAVWDANLGFDFAGQGAPPSQVLPELVGAGIEPLICLSPWGDRPARTKGDENEWWQYCFAVAYWCNVRNGLGLTRWQVLNEPSLDLQGGSSRDYLDMLVLAVDAIETANGIAGIPTEIHAANDITGGDPRGYLVDTLQAHDDLVDVVDYHNYADYFAERDAAEWIFTLLPQLDKDGVIEPLWVSEFGTLSRSYDDRSVALDVAHSLYVLSDLENRVDPDAYCQGANIFVINDWFGWQGIISTTGSRRETYYALRLVIRALQGARPKLVFNTGHPGAPVLVTEDGTGGVFVLLLSVGGTVDVDVWSLGIDSATATVYEYSASFRDEVVATVPVVRGRLSAQTPGSGLSLIEIR